MKPVGTLKTIPYNSIKADDDSIYIPSIEPCDECEEFEGRLKNLEECCSDVWAKLLDHDTRIETLEAQIQTKQNLLTPADNTIIISEDTIRANLSNIYTKSQVDALISSVQGTSIEVVQTLPATGESNIIYLVPNGRAVPDIYDEYVYISGNWEKIGSTDIDLSGYVTDSELTAALADKAGTNAVTNITRSGTTFTATRANGTTFTFTQQDNTGAPLNSPAFTGTPTAPTAGIATNNTQIATTAFVHSLRPKMTSYAAHPANWTCAKATTTSHALYTFPSFAGFFIGSFFIDFNLNFDANTRWSVWLTIGSSSSSQKIAGFEGSLYGGASPKATLPIAYQFSSGQVLYCHVWHNDSKDNGTLTPYIRGLIIPSAYYSN